MLKLDFPISTDIVDFLRGAAREQYAKAIRSPDGRRR